MKKKATAKKTATKKKVAKKTAAKKKAKASTTTKKTAAKKTTATKKKATGRKKLAKPATTSTRTKAVQATKAAAKKKSPSVKKKKTTTTTGSKRAEAEAGAKAEAKPKAEAKAEAKPKAARKTKAKPETTPRKTGKAERAREESKGPPARATQVTGTSPEPARRAAEAPPKAKTKALPKTKAPPKTKATMPSRSLRRRRTASHAPSPQPSSPPPSPPIPPLPEEEDEFIPFEDDGAGQEPARNAPPDLPPKEILQGVRRGDLHVSALNQLSDDQVVGLARSLGFDVRPQERRSETLYRLLQESPPTPRRAAESVFVEGLLELHPDGYGFLRRPERSYVQHPDDVYVGAGLVRKLGLRAGHWVSGTARRSRPNEPLLALQQVEEVNHEDAAALKDVTTFENLTVVYPDQRFLLEVAPEDYEMRVMDLFCPLGRGQRALIVSPPRAGKTVILQKLADAVAHNSPNVDIVVLLVDERPEEVTNMRRSVRGEVIASTFDKPAANHIRVAELVMEKVKRMVEFGRHVVLLLDSITRLGRAYNNMAGQSGRILTGGLEAKALTKPKRFFGAARNIEGGGSLTIVATALVDTGSRMDEVIFEEFKGSGNMEVVLDRHLANARIWPAINIPASGTRNEDLLLHPEELRRVNLLRKAMSGQPPQGVMEGMREQMAQYRTNAELLMSMG